MGSVASRLLILLAFFDRRHRLVYQSCVQSSMALRAPPVGGWNVSATLSGGSTDLRCSFFPLLRCRQQKPILACSGNPVLPHFSGLYVQRRDIVSPQLSLNQARSPPLRNSVEHTVYSFFSACRRKPELSLAAIGCYSN